MNYLGKLIFALLISSQAQAKLIIHEWGTFTSLVGSDGKAQSGMYQEDEPLPSFITSFGDGKISPLQSRLNTSFAWAPPGDQPWPAPTPDPQPHCPGAPKVPCDFLLGKQITQKMETPVVYFYSDTAQTVNFDVSFPDGIISQSYPAPLLSRPEAIPGIDLKNGFAHYKVNVLKNTSLPVPSVPKTNIYSHARNVASDLIQIGNQVEKFIFYRGLGEFVTDLQVTSHGGNLHLQNLGNEQIPQAFLIYTDGKDHGGFTSLGAIDAHKGLDLHSPQIENLQSTSQSVFLKSIQAPLLAALTEGGLFTDEARAMLDTWQNGYFKTPGLRVLYVLNRTEVESILPLQISPQPTQLRRVFIGRIEILLDTVEEQTLQRILKQGASYDTTHLGRMSQPILLRVKSLAQAKGVLTQELASDIDLLIANLH